jgi:hypothetical protein
MYRVVAIKKIAAKRVYNHVRQIKPIATPLDI